MVVYFICIIIKIIKHIIQFVRIFCTNTDLCIPIHKLYLIGLMKLLIGSLRKVIVHSCIFFLGMYT